ncbi:DUF1722 domain-containing protein [Streptococcus sp. E17BB]|uniref:DUF1722 domain-containing protein n=1 Tax=Streptococcus sp. E17BB TaxID=3278714 RepID=UPI00359D1A15
MMTSIQAQWAYHKYWVMGHSQAHYNAIRLLFKGNDWSADKEKDFYRLLAEAQAIAPTGATLRTAYQHIWGYFKKVANDEERDAYKEMIGDETTYEELGEFLVQMIENYQPKYLVNSKFYEDGGL